MEIKSNQATDLRPEGKRILDAPLVAIDINKFIENLRDEKTWKTSDRNAITVYKTEGMSIVLIAIHEGAVIPKHVAPGILSLQLLEGEISFTTDEESVNLTEGMMVTLHKSKPHSVTALKKSVFLLTVAH